MFADTHVHFDPAAPDEGIVALVARARSAGVRRFVAVGHNPAANEAALRIEALFPGVVRAAVGFDRSMAADRPDLAELERMACGEGRGPGTPGRVSAIGEIGLDYYYSPDTVQAQRGLMEAQLELARRTRLPVIVHSRDAENDTAELLQAHARQWQGSADRIGVLHCFTGSESFARRLLDLGFMISFSGIVTFRNADPLRAVAKLVPTDRLLIETDSPYLAPVPHRGKTNEPAFLPAVAAVVAAARGVKTEDVAALTSANAACLFGFPLPLRRGED